MPGFLFIVPLVMPPSHHHITYAAATACGAVFFLFMMNVLGKLVADTYTPIEAVFWRNFMSVLVILPFVLYRFRGALPPMGKPKTMITRGVFGSITLMLSMTAYFNLPLADANAIILSAPLVLTLLAAGILKENVTRARLMCTFVGLIGVLLVAQPSGQISTFGLVCAIAAAISVAFMRVLLRHLGKTEDPLAMTFYFLLIGAVFTAPLMLFLGKLPLIHTFPVLIAMGCCGALGQYLNGVSYKYGDASFVGIFVYTQLVWAIPFDYFLWDHAPHLNTLIGGGVIIASNLYIIWQERQRQRRLATIEP